MLATPSAATIIVVHTRGIRITPCSYSDMTKMFKVSVLAQNSVGAFTSASPANTGAALAQEIP
jgi:hypothetical protein